jgi:nicotinate-nucleotide--dimethylbenzimidazole phosphoribosyltransferase
MSLLSDTLSTIPGADATARSAAHDRLCTLTMPHWALGRLMDTAERLAAMTASLHPALQHTAIAVFAGDHGVCAEGVSAYPAAVTPQMVANFVAGGAGVNAIARVSGAHVLAVDVGVAGDLGHLNGRYRDERIRPGTANLAQGPAMSRDEAIRSIEAGIRTAQSLCSDADLLAAGDMGIGNTTPSSCITACLTGSTAEVVTGRGTGIDDATHARKTQVVAHALHVNQPDPSDGLDVLSKVGGLEIGAIAGFYLGCAAARKPVVVDGFIATAGALIAQTLQPRVTDHLIAGHQSVEPGHRLALAHLRLEALLDLGLRLGEGSGAALAFPLVQAAGRLLSDVATFDEAAVSGRSPG